MDLIDKRDEILRIFLEYGITENTENDLTKTDLADCAEQIVKKLILSGVSNAKRTVCEKHVCVESKVNVGYRVCVNCYALFPIAN